MNTSPRIGTPSNRSRNLFDRGQKFSSPARLTVVVKSLDTSDRREVDLVLSLEAQQGCAGHHQYQTGGYSVGMMGQR